MTEYLDLTEPICCPLCAKELAVVPALPEPGDLPTRPTGATPFPVRFRLTCICGKELYVRDLGFTGDNGQQMGELYRPQR